MGIRYGYVRVSTADQNEARQIDAMTEAGIIKKNMYIDKVSGKDFDRPAWHRLVRRVKSGDVIFIKSLDRMGRNYDDIEKQWTIIKDKGVDIVIMDMPLLDTRINENGLTGRFISDMVLKVLSYVSQMERENIRQRQKEGIEAARKRGVRCGRPLRELPADFETVYADYLKGKYTVRQAAGILGMHYSSFYNYVKRRRKPQQ